MTPELRRNLRRRWGLPPDPPSPYVSIPVDLVHQAARRASREGTKVATVSTLAIMAVTAPLYLLVSPLVGMIAILALGRGLALLCARRRSLRTVSAVTFRPPGGGCDELEVKAGSGSSTQDRESPEDPEVDVR